MEQKSIGFVGGGRITRIFLQAFKNKKFKNGIIKVHDTSKEILISLKNRFLDIKIADSLGPVFRQEIVFIAIHPPVIMDTLDKMKHFITDDSVIVSLAPKISIEKIIAKLGVRNIVRMIPSATSYINEGYNPLCFAGSFESDKSQLIKIFEVMGKTFDVPEDKLETYV